MVATGRRMNSADAFMKRPRNRVWAGLAGAGQLAVAPHPTAVAQPQLALGDDMVTRLQAVAHDDCVADGVCR